MPTGKKESLDKNLQQISNSSDQIRLYAEQCIQKGNLSDVLLWVKQAELINDHELIADIYNNLGVAYCEQNHFSGAIDYYKKALELRESIFGKSLKVADIYSNLAIVHTNLGEYKQAEIYHNYCISLEKPKYNNELHMIRFLNNFAYMYLLKNEFKNSKKYYEDALRKCDDLNESEKQNIIFYELLLNLGRACQALNELNEAKYYYLSSLEYARLYYDKSHQRYIDVLDALADIEFKKRDLPLYCFWSAEVYILLLLSNSEVNYATKKYKAKIRDDVEIELSAIDEKLIKSEKKIEKLKKTKDLVEGFLSRLNGCFNKHYEIVFKSEKKEKKYVRDIEYYKLKIFFDISQDSSLYYNLSLRQISYAFFLNQENIGEKKLNLLFQEAEETMLKAIGMQPCAQYYAMLSYNFLQRACFNEALKCVLTALEYQNKESNELLEFRLNDDSLLLDPDLELFLQVSGGVIRFSSALFISYVAIRAYQALKNFKSDYTELKKTHLDLMTSAIETSEQMEDNVLLALIYKSEDNFVKAKLIFKNILDDNKQINNQAVVLWAEKNYTECQKKLIEERIPVISRILTIFCKTRQKENAKKEKDEILDNKSPTLKKDM